MHYVYNVCHLYVPNILHHYPNCCVTQNYSIIPILNEIVISFYDLAACIYSATI